jgi:hypothetical protein
VARTPSTRAPAAACQCQPPSKRSPAATPPSKKPPASKRGDATGNATAALELRRERLQPSASPRRGAEREQDHVLREHRELQVELLGSDRKDKVDREGRDGDQKRDTHHLRAAKAPPDRRQRVTVQCPPERKGQREDEQRLEEPGRPRREVPHLLAHERPKRLGAVVVLAIGDVLEERADQKGVGHERDPEPDQPILREEPRPLASERRRAQAARNQEEQTEAEQPAHAKNGRDEIDHRTGHLVVRLEVPGSVESIRDRGVHRDHADDQQDL